MRGLAELVAAPLIYDLSGAEALLSRSHARNRPNTQGLSMLGKRFALVMLLSHLRFGRHTVAFSTCPIPSHPRTLCQESCLFGYVSPSQVVSASQEQLPACCTRAACGGAYARIPHNHMAWIQIYMHQG